MRQRTEGMWHSVLLASLLLKSVNAFNDNAVSCPDRSDITGYTSIEALKADMDAETARIEGGGTPASSYDFVICPSPTAIQFTDAEPLVPTLSGTTIRCGDLNAECTFQGGTQQILIQDSDIAGYNLESITLVGLKFAGFSEAAVTGTAAATTTVNVFDSTFTNIDGATTLTNQDGLTSADGTYTLNLRGITIDGVNQPVDFDFGFRNDGGTLRVDDLNVNGVANADALVTSANEANTFIEDATVQSSNIVDVFSADSGASIVAIRTDITDMDNMRNGYLILENADLTMQSSSISNINLSGTDFWQGVQGGIGATINIINSDFIDGTNAERLVACTGSDTSSTTRCTLNLNKVQFVNLQGTFTADRVSGVVYGQEADITLNNVVVDNPGNYLAAYFGTVNTAITVADVCLRNAAAGDQVVWAVFNSVDSTFSPSNLYIANTEGVEVFETLLCGESEGRLSQGGDNCFVEGSNGCPEDDFTCTESTGRVDECTADLVFITDAPSSAPTSPPQESDAPSSTPTTFSPTISDMPSAVPTNHGVPSGAPTISLAPTISNAPSISNAPTIAPTISAAPTITAQPTNEPTISPQPTVSPAPTGKDCVPQPRSSKSGKSSGKKSSKSGGKKSIGKKSGGGDGTVHFGDINYCPEPPSSSSSKSKSGKKNSSGSGSSKSGKKSGHGKKSYSSSRKKRRQLRSVERDPASRSESVMSSHEERPNNLLR